MNSELHTQAVEWEDSLAASPQETLEHCRGLTDVQHLQPLFDVLPPGSRVVEAGCGLGQFVYMFAALGHHCIGLDYSAKLVADAEVRGRGLTDLPGSTEWKQGTILDMPFDDNSLDCYASFGVLEHFTRSQQRVILSEAYRVLRPDGILYQFVPNFWSPWTIRREIRYWYRKMRPPSIVWQRNIRRSRLRKICRAAGFEECSCSSFYAELAISSMKLPSFLRKACPQSLRTKSSRAAEALGGWCDKKDVLGYGLAYVGKKVA